MAKSQSRTARAANPGARALYDVHPSVAMVQNWVSTLREKTGRSLDDWLTHIQTEGPPTEAERRAWLKSTHKLGTNTAGWLAERAEGKGHESEDPETYLRQAAAWVDTMYSGKKGALRPIFEELCCIGRSLGDDVRICPCSTIVPLFRTHVIAQVKPTTNTRVDLGLALGETAATRRLIDTGGFAKKDRITHRIPLASPAEIEDEVMYWMQAAYDRDAARPTTATPDGSKARR